MLQARNSFLRKRLEIAGFCVLFALSISFAATSGTPSESRQTNPGGCAEGLVRVEEGCLRKPEPLEKVSPIYPKEAHKKGVEASVLVSARVGVDGSIEAAKAVDSEATDQLFLPAFEEAAVTAVRKWRYRPGMLNGKPAAVFFSVTINFRLK